MTGIGFPQQKAGFLPGALLRTTIHEIRNHLAVAVANVEAFLDGKLEPSPKRLSAVLQSLNEITVLLQELTLAAGPDSKTETSIDPRLFDVCEVISNEVLALEATARAQGIDYRVVACDVRSAECANFFGDPVRIAEIVNNVVANAIRYTPRGARVEVACRRATGELTLTVRDTGPGIRLDELDRIFERGFRGSAAGVGPGSGIGLSVVKDYVTRHGGSVEVSRDEPIGARFIIRLPGVPVRTAVPGLGSESGVISIL